VESAGEWGECDPLAAPEFILERRRRGHAEDAIRKVVHDNPLNFWRQSVRWPRTTAQAPLAREGKKEVIGSY
jgi:hypothetical protein